MTKRKHRRMFTREERRAYAAAREAAPKPTVAKRDRAELDAWNVGRTPVAMAELWLGLHEEPQRSADETRLMVVVRREFERRTGDLLTVDMAENVIEAADSHENPEARAWATSPAAPWKEQP